MKEQSEKNSSSREFIISFTSEHYYQFQIDGGAENTYKLNYYSRFSCRPAGRRWPDCSSKNDDHGWRDCRRRDLLGHHRRQMVAGATKS
jgi:hypothetical protein